MLIDTHAHLNFNAYKDGLDGVIRRSLDNDVWMINVGSQYTTSKRAVEIAEKYPEGVYAAVGLHPLHLNSGLVKVKIDKEEVSFNSREEEFDYEKYKNLALSKNLDFHSVQIKELARNKKVIAIGEVGLDYYYKPKTKRKLELFKEKQKKVVLKQLKLAKELNLPVIFHCRVAHKDLISLLKENPELKPERAVAHGFVGNSEELKQYLELGLYIGLNGIMFKNIEGIDFEENIRNTPLDRILLETDCPYLTPPQEEGRNEPTYIRHIAERAAQIKGLKVEEISKITTENAKKVFKI